MTRCSTAETDQLFQDGAAPDLSGMRVLVVDDLPVSRSMLVQMLGVLGVLQVAEAASGMDALNHLMQADFDVVLSDFNMPVMSGADLLQHVRKGDRNRTVSFVIVTGCDRWEDVTETPAEVEALLKPYTLAQLRACLERFAP